MSTVTLRIEGMSCSHCVGAVQKALVALPGVQVKDVRIGSAEVAYDASTMAPERIAAAVTDEGYAATVAA